MVDNKVATQLVGLVSLGLVCGEVEEGVNDAELGDGFDKAVCEECSGLWSVISVGGSNSES